MSKRINRHTGTMSSKSKTHTVTEIADGIYDVVSGSSGKTYRVCVGAHGQGASCTCDWGRYRKAGQASACSHTLAVYKWLAEREGNAASAWANETDAKRQHRHIVRDLDSDGVLLTERRS